MKVGKVVEEWKIWDKENKAVKLEEEAKRLVSKRFYKWIHIFNKKVSKQMSTKKLWNYMIDTKERICAKEGEGISAVKGRERRSMQVHIRTTEERVYQTLKFISNSTDIFHRKEG